MVILGIMHSIKKRLYALLHEYSPEHPCPPPSRAPHDPGDPHTLVFCWVVAR